MINPKDSARGEAGQVALVFIASMVIIIAAMALLIDGGRYLVMRNRARMMADAAAITGAGFINVLEAGSGNFVLDEFAAGDAAEDNFDKNTTDSPEYADFSLEDVRVQGNRIWVTVTGSSSPLFGSQWGLKYSTTIISSARAGTGISSEK